MRASGVHGLSDEFSHGDYESTYDCCGRSHMASHNFSEFKPLGVSDKLALRLAVGQPFGISNNLSFSLSLFKPF